MRVTDSRDGRCETAEDEPDTDPNGQQQNGEGYAILLLAIWIGVGFVFRGFATTVAAVSDPHLPGRGWAIFFGIITILAGIIVLGYPFDSLVTLTLVIGMWLIIIGVMEIISSFGIRSDEKKLNEVVAGANA